ncbi:MAG: hypothetical protein P8H62_14920, partial [Henriciella sp.]|nr:hypothetical protein [Henriciella sp.]
SLAGAQRIAVNAPYLKRPSTKSLLSVSDSSREFAPNRAFASADDFTAWTSNTPQKESPHLSVRAQLLLLTPPIRTTEA